MQLDVLCLQLLFVGVKVLANYKYRLLDMLCLGLLGSSACSLPAYGAHTPTQKRSNEDPEMRPVGLQYNPLAVVVRYVAREEQQDS